MTATAADQLRRVLRLIPSIADGADHSFEEIRDVLGVGRDTLRGDLVSLVERYDDPGGFVQAVQVYYDDRNVSVVTPHFLRPMRLTMAELCALELGLMLLRSETPPDEHAVIDGALARLREAITHVPANDRLRDSQYAELGADGDASHLATARDAFRDRRKLRLRYHASRATEPGDRVVHPYGFVYSAPAWYLVAHCEQSGELRFFRLDRVVAAEATTDGYDLPDDFSLDALIADGKPFHADTDEGMQVRFSPRIARWIAERERAHLEPDGSVVVRYPIADEEWAMRHVLQYGPDAEVLEPQWLRSALLERLRRIKQMS